MDYTVKDLPKSERPQEKLMEKGVKSLTEVELLSLILRSGISGKNVKELCAEILNKHSLKELSNQPITELERFRGVSSVKAGQLKAVSELSKRLKNESRMKLENLGDVKSVVKDMKYEDEEELRVFYLKSSNEIIEKSSWTGGISSVKFEPRNILKTAVRKNAAAIILAHNHPSGKSNPTEEDIKSTRSVIEAAEPLGITVLDHVVVGKQIRSMRTCTDLDFS